MPIAEDSCNAKTGQNSARKQHWPGKFSLPPLATARFLKKRTQHTISTSANFSPRNKAQMRRSNGGRRTTRTTSEKSKRRDEAGYLRILVVSPPRHCKNQEAALPRHSPVSTESKRPATASALPFFPWGRETEPPLHSFKTLRPLRLGR
jgi:hypothetical protein